MTPHERPARADVDRVMVYKGQAAGRAGPRNTSAVCQFRSGAATAGMPTLRQYDRLAGEL